jgi:2-polyprenyl-6-methoxyphenol hydroxylase-like FAD-dependent oxidoreductase
MEVLIVGAGIAGPTLAYWLDRLGHRPTLVERAPAPRTGGHLVDFWGAGFDVAERMGTVAELHRRSYRITTARAVDGAGRRFSTFAPDTFIPAPERYVSISRSDLAATLYATIDGQVETLFDDTVECIDDDGDRVRATFRRHPARSFDLVVGADGLHSRVRRLVFGAPQQFERRLGIVVAAVEIDGYRPRDELTAVMHAGVGHQAVRVSLRDDVTLFLLTVRHGGDTPVEDRGAQQHLLRSLLAGAAWEIPAVLDRLSSARSFYFDRADQIRMPSWSRGRVALIGDAASCPSLLAGQGSALAMVQAYVLAAELAAAGGDHVRAFARYDAQLQPLLRRKQDAAIGLGRVFAPRNRAELLARNAMIRAVALPWIAKLAMGRTLQDGVELPALT